MLLLQSIFLKKQRAKFLALPWFFNSILPPHFFHLFFLFFSGRTPILTHCILVVPFPSIYISQKRGLSFFCNLSMSKIFFPPFPPYLLKRLPERTTKKSSRLWRRLFKKSIYTSLLKRNQSLHPRGKSKKETINLFSNIYHVHNTIIKINCCQI